MPREMTPAQFVAKWSKTELSERAASQEHFIDLCHLLGQPTPAEHDATGAEYTFEKGVAVTAGASRGAKGRHGFADVWWRGKFAWEYKRKDKDNDLIDAYRQLCQYREALENPPLLIVSDIARTEIHTNFTGTAKQVHVIELPDLAKPENISLLRRVFTDPASFRPTVTPEVVTEEAARQIGRLAQALRQRGHDPHQAAHFLMKCTFCLFAEDVGLLPRALFERLVKQWKSKPAELLKRMTDLFDQMRSGGAFGVDEIAYFNGGLFDELPALELTPAEADILLTSARQDWSCVEPAIFGTLFERSLDPNTRAQIGAHYTSKEDILLVVEPVVMTPLRGKWEETQARVDEQLERRRKVKTKDTKSKADEAIENILRGFIYRLSTVRILDPACGSGNFLYVAIQQLLDLEKEVITYAARADISIGLFPQVRPTQLHGIEINPYAAELAQVVIWIGYLQWMRDNGFIQGLRKPILEPIQSIEQRDAILDLSDPENPRPAEWPEAEFIIGNPPFLGSRNMRGELGDPYVDRLQSAYRGLPEGADLCCYWFEQALTRIGRSEGVRVGLLATRAIRGGSSRRVLERITAKAIIFNAISEREWPLDGANVDISIICFEAKTHDPRVLDEVQVETINPDLTADVDTTESVRLAENRGISFQGSINSGPFDLSPADARRMLALPNPGGNPNSHILRQWLNGADVTRRPRGQWIVDFAVGRDLSEAALYESPFAYLEAHVKPGRDSTKYAPSTKYPFWQLWCARPEMRDALHGLSRFLAVPRVAKHRLFLWVPGGVLPDAQLIAFARADDYFLGALQSLPHVLWSLRRGTFLEDRPRYTPTTCFETFPLPWAPGQEPEDHPAYKRIAEAAKELNDQRERWLNPPEWLEPIAAAVDAEDDFADVPREARGLIRESAIMARAAKDARLKKRTLTNLYNERPTWLKLAHERLDRAVLAAYAAVDPEGDWSEDWAKAWVETGAGQPLPDGHQLAEQRREIEQRVLANLLRLNLARAQGG